MWCESRTSSRESSQVILEPPQLHYQSIMVFIHKPNDVKAEICKSWQYPIRDHNTTAASPKQYAVEWSRLVGPSGYI